MRKNMIVNTNVKYNSQILKKDINLKIIVKLSSCLQLATSGGLSSKMSALAAATGQAQQPA